MEPRPRPTVLLVARAGRRCSALACLALTVSVASIRQASEQATFTGRPRSLALTRTFGTVSFSYGAARSGGTVGAGAGGT